MTPDDQRPGTRDGGRLRDHEVAKQLTAADAVLIALGRSSSDAGAVLATVAEVRGDSAGVGGPDLPAARRRIRARRDSRRVARSRALPRPASAPTGQRHHGGPGRSGPADPPSH